MASNPRKRQQKLERRAAKRKEKKHVQARAAHAGLPERVEAAAKYPILDAWISDNVWNDGIGAVLVSRQLPNTFVAVAVFLVDRYCLGVKNAYADILGRFSYDSKYVRQQRNRFPAQDVEPAKARKLVEDAVAYAQKLGFPPHPDYQTARLIFGDIDASACHETFEFGKNGKPLFIAGPNDTPARSRQIVNTLTRACGPGGFHFLMPVGEHASILGLEDEDEALLEGEDDLDGDEE